MMKSTIKGTGLRSLLVAVTIAAALGWTMSARAEESATATVIPSSVPAIWAAIDKETAETMKEIESGTLNELHHHAFAIRDLVTALPGRSSSLSAADLAKLKVNVKFVGTLAERLDAAGDSNDKAASESNFTKLKGILKTIRSLYPNAVAK